VDIQKVERSDGTVEVTLSGKPLTCTACGSRLYRRRKSFLKTRDDSEDFRTDREVSSYICANCGYIYNFWFSS